MPSLDIMTKITGHGASLTLRLHRIAANFTKAYRATRNCSRRTWTAAQRRPGLRGEWFAQQMTYETDIFASLSAHTIPD
jgi:hypothetical protein